MPEVPGLSRFVVNWRALSPRHQKRVALSVAPWKAFIPVLVEGGATFYIKPMYQLLSESPGQQALRDLRIDYDSRLWDDVRGCGGYRTVTGIEDVERTIFDRYDTVIHELTHQVHGVLPADDVRAIEDHYRDAKSRDRVEAPAFLSRYAAGSVWEYFAEGANALHSPKRDPYDPREVVRERLDALDPALRGLVEGFWGRTDVAASYPIAYVNAGDDQVSNGRVGAALPFYRRALARSPGEESAHRALVGALTLKGDGRAAVAAAERAAEAQPASGPVQVAAATARWHAGRGLAAARAALDAARPVVRASDRLDLDLERGRLAWIAGDAAASLAAYDSALARQADHPGALRGRAEALALAGRWDEAFAAYDQAVRLRTGIVDLRNAYARDLLRAGRTDAAAAQLDAARLLDPTDPDAEALRGAVALGRGDADSAAACARRALALGEWCDLARFVLGVAEAKRGDTAAARAAWAPLERRIAANTPPRWVYRAGLSTWQEVHTLPAVLRGLLEGHRGG
jgi:tetratricopeptide (TPR) repeat protein